MSEQTRRQFVASGAAITVAALTPTASATTGTTYQWEDDGDRITREYDEEELRAYLPYFDIEQQDLEQLIGVYGWIARSPDHDTDAYYYWMRYSHQDAAADRMGFLDRAVGILSSDSHLWDHEPSIIYVNRRTGEVEKAIVTGYHHYPLEVSGSNAPLVEDRVPGLDTHLSLYVVPPWHHYMLADEDDVVDVTNHVGLRSFIDIRDSWERRNIFENSNPLAIDNPWAMADKRAESWWDEDTWDARAARLWNRLGLRGAEDVEPGVEIPD